MLYYKAYDRARAYEYAKKWAFDRNPLYFDYTGIGGNCTNFVSQALYAGSCVMNFTPVYGWYFLSDRRRTASWTGVEFFYDFLTQKFTADNGGVGPFATEVAKEAAEIGDVIQYANSSGDWYHTVIITGRDGDEILVSAQSNDALDRPISTYNFASARFLHIEGVNISLDDNTCYSVLLRGGVEEVES